jgi:hypothetical protein
MWKIFWQKRDGESIFGGICGFERNNRHTPLSENREFDRIVKITVTFNVNSTAQLFTVNY